MKFSWFKKLFSSIFDYYLVILIFYIFLVAVVSLDVVIFVSWLCGVVSVSNGSFLPILGIPNLNIYMIFVVFGAALLAVVLLMRMIQIKGMLDFCSLKRYIIAYVFFICFFIGIFQMIAHTLIFKEILSQKSGYGIYQEIVNNAYLIQKNYSYCQRFQLCTDLDLSEDPGMLVHRIFRYFLFPKEISTASDDDIECILYIKKKDYIHNLPEEFIIIQKFSSQDAIAARKDIFY